METKKRKLNSKNNKPKEKNKQAAIKEPFRDIAGIFKDKIIEAKGDIYNLSL